ncbi:hypothetical protein [Vampirovibrio chlorellavorus]|uniref:hypothetical protein n=1 Tax=Vampirovibrio chlorellavorus TaxID=758823 RepID=UPI0026F0C649|nr:hypothetical protein [Vampirovibrio chlorellavorus]
MMGSSFSLMLVFYMLPSPMNSRPELLSIGLGLLFCVFLLHQPALADCKTHYDQSVQLLDANLQKSKEPNSKTDADAFEASFKEAVKKLQGDKCMPELMNLIQHIQTEQQKHPRTSQNNKPTPIVD